jgi:DNA-directed RNA polymerase subunit H
LFKQLDINHNTLKAKMPTPSSKNLQPHVLQPKHFILKQKDAEELLAQYNISLGQLPKIKISDPALPEGANVGDVIKIERKDESGTHPYYRVVVL